MIVPCRFVSAPVMLLRNIGRLCIELQLVAMLKPTALPQEMTVAET